jgi:hypothetical protein
MTNTYNWVIEQLDCYPEKDGHTVVSPPLPWA